MTGYYAYYKTVMRKPNNTIVYSDTDIYPVVGFTDVALIIDTDGRVRTVHELLDDLREGSGVPDEDGDTFTVRLEVRAGDE